MPAQLWRDPRPEPARRAHARRGAALPRRRRQPGRHRRHPARRAAARQRPGRLSCYATEDDPAGVGGLVRTDRQAGIPAQARTAADFVVLAFPGLDMIDPGLVLGSECARHSGPGHCRTRSTVRRHQRVTGTQRVPTKCLASSMMLSLTLLVVCPRRALPPFATTYLASSPPAQSQPGSRHDASTGRGSPSGSARGNEARRRCSTALQHPLQTRRTATVQRNDEDLLLPGIRPPLRCGLSGPAPSIESLSATVSASAVAAGATPAVPDGRGRRRRVRTDGGAQTRLFRPRIHVRVAVLSPPCALGSASRRPV